MRSWLSDGVEKERFVVIDEVLCYVDPGGQHRLRIVVHQRLKET